MSGQFGSGASGSSPPLSSSTRSVAAAAVMVFLGHPLIAVVVSNHNRLAVDFHFPPECKALVQKFYRVKAQIEAERARATCEPFTAPATVAPLPSAPADHQSDPTVESHRHEPAAAVEPEAQPVAVQSRSLASGSDFAERYADFLPAFRARSSSAG